MIEVPAAWFTGSALALLKRQLTATSPSFFNPKVKVVTLFYRETGHQTIWVPRFWAVKNARRFSVLNEAWQQPFPRQFSVDGELSETADRPQQTVFAKTIEQLRQQGGASMILPPGTGKTNVAIAVALSMRQKTLVLCFNNFLLEQWRGRLKSFVREKDMRIGTLQQDTAETDNCMFVLCSVQSLVSRAYDPEHLRYGLVIIDESHHIAASTFSSCLEKLTYFYSLSLTATPKRGDGLEQMVYYLAGFPSYVHEAPKNDSVQVSMIVYGSGSQKIVQMGNGKVNSSLMITLLTQDRRRNDLILHAINLLLGKYPGRKGLLLSDRVDHLLHLYGRLDPSQTALITGRINTEAERQAEEEEKEVEEREQGKKKKKKKAKKREPVFDKRLTLSTYSMFAEAVDFDGDFLILSTPKSRVEQAVGRILRGRDLEHAPVVIDVVDPFSVFENQRRVRQQFYIKRGYSICQLQDLEVLRCPVYA